MLKTRHSSLDIADGDSAVKKKHVMLTKARNKLMNFGDAALRMSRNLNGDVEHGKKSVVQSSLDYFFKVLKKILHELDFCGEKQFWM